MPTNHTLFVTGGKHMSVFDNKLSGLLASLPDGFKLSYEITDGVIVWSITEKPMGFSAPEEQALLDKLNALSLELTAATSRPVVDLQGAERNTQKYFAFWLYEKMPYLIPLFDFEKREYRLEAIDRYLKVAEQDKCLMARFAIGVWRGDNEFKFNFFDAAGYLDRLQIKIVTDWMTDPFWP